MFLKIKYFPFIIALLCAGSSPAQNFILYGDKTFGGNLSDGWVTLVKAGDNYLVLSGATGTNANGEKTDPLCDSTQFDTWLLKIDTGFNIVWDKSIGGERGELNPWLIKSGNNKMIFACSSNSDSSCEKSENSRSFPSIGQDYWICMIDSIGNKIWDKTLGGSSGGDDLPRIIQLSTGDYIVAGTSASPISGDKTVANYGMDDYWVVKLDSMGNKLWDKVYGGTSTESNNLYYETFSVLSDTLDAFILAGTTDSPISGDISDTSRGVQDVWLIKLDSAGTRIWDRRFGGSGADKCAHIIHANDNGYILCGTTSSPQDGDVSDSSRGVEDCWVIKLDSLGNKQWDKRYGGNRSDIGTWIECAPGGGYWVYAKTKSDSGFEVSEPRYGTSIVNDYWIFKIDETGAKLWDKRFGGPGDDIATNFIIMPDSSIFLCGQGFEGTSAVKTDSGKGAWDYWVVHFKYTEGYVSISENPAAVTNFTVYPNPATDKLQLTFGRRPRAAEALAEAQGAEDATIGSLQKVTIIILNLVGEEVLQTKTETANTTIDIKHLAAGMYFITIQTEEGKKSVKFVKE